MGKATQNWKLWGPTSPRSQRTTATSFGGFSDRNERDDSPDGSRRSWTRGSVNSIVSDVSLMRLPLTTSGYFSNPKNFSHFVECAQSYMCPGPGESLATADAVSLRVIF